MITMHSWMFLSSFEKLRKKLLKDNTIVNMVHLGARAFEDISGEVVQTTAFVFDNVNITNYQSTFKRLVDFNSQNNKEIEYLKDANLYISSAVKLQEKIPGSSIAYWVSKNVYNSFDEMSIGQVANLCQGLSTTDNNKYVRTWEEVSIDKIRFNCSSLSDAKASNGVWFPFNKGGSFRKWYGNNI